MDTTLCVSCEVVSWNLQLGGFFRVGLLKKDDSGFVGLKEMFDDRYLRLGDAFYIQLQD